MRRRWVLATMMTMATAPAEAGSKPAIPVAGAILVHADEFGASALNRENWYYRESELYTAGYNRRANVTVRGGQLHIRYDHEDVNGDGRPDFTGGGVISRQLFGYGYYEVRARLWTGSPGLHTSFWSMGIHALGGGIGFDPLIARDVRGGRTPEHNQLFEIDGFEHDSPDILDLGTNRQSENADELRDGKKQGAERGIRYDEWNVYGYDYTPEAIRFFINGKLVRTIDNRKVPHQFSPMNLWLTALPYKANPTPEALPGTASFDYFRFYVRSLPGANRLGNASFDAIKPDIPLSVPGGWIETGDRDASAIVESGAHDGTRALRQQAPRPYRVTTKQILKHLPNGHYVLAAWVLSSGGQAEATMTVSGPGMRTQVVKIPAAAQWTKIAVPDVAVKRRAATIAFTSQGKSSEWLMIDTVSFAER